MPIKYNNKYINEIYYNDSAMKNVYYGSTLVWQQNPYPVSEVIVNSQGAAGSKDLYGGTYELKIVSAGGSGSTTSIWWGYQGASGGAGAAWEGTFKLASRVTISWTAPTFAGGGITLTAGSSTWLTLTGGSGGTGSSGGAGGALTIDSSFAALVLTTIVSAAGSQGAGTSQVLVTGVYTNPTPSSSTLGWGQGADNKNANGSAGGIYLKRVA